MKSKSLQWGWITLGGVLLVNVAFSKFPAIYEFVYFRALFQAIRVIYDYTLAWLPFPSVYWIIAVIFASSIIKIQWTLKSFARRLLLILLWLISLFYLLWGFNYQQKSLKQRLDLYSEAIDSCYIYDSFMQQSARLDELTPRLTDGAISNLENKIRPLQESLLTEWGWPVLGRVRVRQLIPGSLLHFRTSGIYIPHAFEGHIDAGLYYRQHAFTMAHEMAHGYGVTDESECNFVAYLTCIRSDNPLIVYSAELAYWRYLAGYYRKLYRQEWTDNYTSMNPVLLADLKKIHEHNSKYKDWMPEYRDVIYDNYLKTHGIAAGIRSYDLMVELIKAYRDKD